MELYREIPKLREGLGSHSNCESELIFIYLVCDLILLGHPRGVSYLPPACPGRLKFVLLTHSSLAAQTLSVIVCSRLDPE